MPDLTTRPCEGCGAMIVWAWTPAGKRMPLDPDPVAASDHTWVIEGDRCRPSEPMFDPPGTVHHQTHWVSCSERDRFRR